MKSGERNHYEYRYTMVENNTNNIQSMMIMNNKMSLLLPSSLVRLPRSRGKKGYIFVFLVVSMYALCTNPLNKTLKLNILDGISTVENSQSRLMQQQVIDTIYLNNNNGNVNSKNMDEEWTASFGDNGKNENNHYPNQDSRNLLQMNDQQHHHHHPSSSFSSLFTPERPLFVLGLPESSGSSALKRYFQCAATDEQQQNDFVGQYWTSTKLTITTAKGKIKTNPQRIEIGTCMKNNLDKAEAEAEKAAKSNNTIVSVDPLKGCGNYSIWLDMDVTRFDNKCYVPSLAQNGLNSLATQYPNATILLVKRNPLDWYNTTLSYDIRQYWSLMCNQPWHFPITFPNPNSTQKEWVHFYQWHYHHVKSFVQAHPTLQYIEIDLDDDNVNVTGQTLQQQLGIPSTCWKKSISTTTREKQQRPNDITYPLFVAALPKSGTSTVHDYFTCGLGKGIAAHKWSVHETLHQHVEIGRCWQKNIQHQKPMLHECGKYRIWSDHGYVGKKCWYPELHGGLQAFYNSYPYGTIFNVIRNATSWYKSAKRWNGDLTERWSKAICNGFPKPNSTQEVWEHFYMNYTESIRQFVHDHPTISYVEIQLESNETSKQLEDIFGFPKDCWGHANKNKQKQGVGVKRF